MDSVIVFFFIAILIIGVLLIVLISVTKKGRTVLDVDRYRSRWLSIESQLKRDEQSTYQLAILSADKLLDQALRDRGMRGQTMGERMKYAKGEWSNRNAIWSAHKVRNRIAHESDIIVGYDETRRALAMYKQGLKDLGAI